VTVDLSNDPHIRALRAALVADHEAAIADARAHAAEAAARGDEWYRRWYQDTADRLHAMPYPWDGTAKAA
jgi:hypothetical protein